MPLKILGLPWGSGRGMQEKRWDTAEVLGEAGRERGTGRLGGRYCQ